MLKQLMDLILYVYVPDSGQNINPFLELSFRPYFKYQGRAAADANLWVIVSGSVVFGPELSKMVASSHSFPGIQAGSHFKSNQILIYKQTIDMGCI